MTLSFYKAIQKASGLRRQMAYYFQKNGLSERAKEWLAAHAICEMHEGQPFLSFMGEDHPVSKKLWGEVKGKQSNLTAMLKASIKKERKTTNKT